MKKRVAIALISLIWLSQVGLIGDLINNKPIAVKAPMVPFYDFVEGSFTQINVTELSYSAHFRLFLDNNLSLKLLTKEVFNLTTIELLASKIFELYNLEASNISIIVCKFPIFSNIVGFYYWLLGDSIYVNFRVLHEKNRYLALPTVIHELSHLLMFKLDPFESTWLQEGFAVFSEVLCGFGVDYYIKPFMRAPETSLTNWSQKLEAYGMVFSFIFYLNLTYGLQILKDIGRSTETSMDSIKSVLGWNQAQLRDFFANFILKIFLNYSEEIDRQKSFYLDSWSAHYIGEYRYRVTEPNLQLGNFIIAFEKPIEYKDFFTYQVFPLLKDLAVMCVVVLIQLGVVHKLLKAIRRTKIEDIKGYS